MNVSMRCKLQLLLIVGAVALSPSVTFAVDLTVEKIWPYSAELLRPFWQGDTMYGESVLFIQDANDQPPHASVLFPIDQVLKVQNSAGTTIYVEGKDYIWKKESRELVLPANSRIKSCKPVDLRRPANSQQYQLPHRDGNGDILFGGQLEYHDLQTCITYSHPLNTWAPKVDERALTRTLSKLQAGRPLRIVVIGDSISAGCNASGWAKGPPFQPPYPVLVRQVLQKQFKSEVTLTNLSVSGMATGWALTMVDKIVEAQPDLVILAFGMNDASGRAVGEYQANTKAVIDRVRNRLPDVEFILVASMIGNPDWVALKQDLFPAYRDALRELCGPGVALVDMTAVWAEFLKVKTYYDQTGNGVNHPNDFGHRIYAQVISALFVPSYSEPK